MISKLHQWGLGTVTTASNNDNNNINNNNTNNNTNTNSQRSRHRSCSSLSSIDEEKETLVFDGVPVDVHHHQQHHYHQHQQQYHTNGDDERECGRAFATVAAMVLVVLSMVLAARIGTHSGAIEFADE